MNIRFIVREGKKILQQAHPIRGHDEYDAYECTWIDVPLFEEPKKPREFWVPDSLRRGGANNWQTHQTAIRFETPENPTDWVLVREVLPGEE